MTACLEIGIVGTGRMARVLGQSLRARGDVTVSVAGSRPGRADALAAEIGGRAVDDAGRLMRDAEAVVIAASTPAHPHLIRMAVEARIPIFCEKPIALDLETTDALIEETTAAGLEMQVGFQRRFDPDVRTVREAVFSGAIGEPYLVRTASHDRLPSEPEFIAGSGGIERDLLIHDFDIARFVTSRRIVRVTAMAGGHGAPGLAAYDEAGDAGVAAGVVEFEGGCLGLVSGLRHHPAGHDVRLEIHGSEGSIAAGWDPGSPLQPAAVNPHQSFLDRFAAAYQGEMDAFVDMVAGRAPNPCPPSDARDAFVVALAAARSRRERRPVDVNEFD